MATWQTFIGVDIASASFTAAVGARPWRLLVKPQEFANTLDGYQALLTWLAEQHIATQKAVVCMEATGVYGEELAYFLAAQGIAVAVEPPLKVKRAFETSGPKTDAVDSGQIAEYAYRFADELSLWQPRSEILEQIQVLLTTREQFVRQRTAHKNALNALKRKVVKTPAAQHAHQQVIASLAKEIKAIEKEIRSLIDQDPDLRQRLLLLLPIPAVGLLMSAHMLLLTQKSLNPRKLSAHLGKAPYPHRSGSSVHRKTQSRHFGPPVPRKLLYLAACSLVAHHEGFRACYERKLAEGKPRRLVLNNIENKLIRIMCAVLRDRQPYDLNYLPTRP